jgi:hypothetical protein
VYWVLITLTAVGVEERAYIDFAAWYFGFNSGLIADMDAPLVNYCLLYALLLLELWKALYALLPNLGYKVLDFQSILLLVL